MGEAPHFDYTFENRFPWGMAQLCLSVENGSVVKAKLYTDSLDTGIPSCVEACLAGVRFEKQALSDAGREGGGRGGDAQRVYSWKNVILPALEL